MALRKILDIEHFERELRRKSRAVEKFDKRLHALLDDMAQTMYEAPGVGLAAAQVSVLRRVVVIDVGEGLLEMVNPQVLHAEGSKEWSEGCLSLPGYRGKTMRPEKVRAKAQDRYGNWFEVEGEDLLALALMHEIEHLDGILYVDHLIAPLEAEEADQEDQP